MNRVVTVLIILIAIISINGLNFVLMNQADATTDSQRVTVIDPSTKIKSGDNLAGGDGGGNAPFSLYPLNLKDVNNFYAIYKSDAVQPSLIPTFAKQFNNFAYEVLGRLAACYGTLYYYLEKQTVVPEYITHNNRYLTNLSDTLLSEYINFKAVQNIMYAAYIDMGDNYKGWLWESFFENKDYNSWWEFNGSNTITFIQNAAGEEDEANRLYCTIMECNLYEVMLNEKITTYPTTRESLEARIALLRERYASTTEYTGFSESDARAFADYILKYVIGISTKNGIAIYNLIKQIINAQLLEAVSAKRNTQLVGKGFLAKGLLRYEVISAEKEIPKTLEVEGNAYTLKYAIINSLYAKSFNGLPILDKNGYFVSIIDNGTEKIHPLMHEKYYYNKWFYVAEGLKVSPIAISDFENFSKGSLIPKGNCLIIKPKNGTRLQLFRSY